MKCNQIRQKDEATKKEKRDYKNRAQIPHRPTREEKLIEVIAKAWIECDPNRQPMNPDDCDKNNEPNWKWFVPRAIATKNYLESKGYKIIKQHRS